MFRMRARRWLRTIYVLGDNRPRSDDSRFFGPIKRASPARQVGLQLIMMSPWHARSEISTRRLRRVPVIEVLVAVGDSVAK